MSAWLIVIAGVVGFGLCLAGPALDDTATGLSGAALLLLTWVVLFAIERLGFKPRRLRGTLGKWYRREGFLQFMLGNLFFDEDQALVREAGGYHVWGFCWLLAMLWVFIVTLALLT